MTGLCLPIVRCTAPALAGILLLGCLAGCRRARDAAPAVHTSGGGDTYVASSIGDASYLNPLLAMDSASGEICSHIFNGLVKYDKDLRLTGDLAERWTVSPDGMVITFYLRRNVRWHDGKPFTAADVLFTYQKLTDPAVKTPFAGDYQLVKRVDARDPYTVRVTYQKPFAPALESWGMGIIPQHVFAAGDFNTHPANRHPVGTGPFLFREWVTDEKIVLDANPAYFEGRPPIARYVYRIIPDQAVQFLELRNQSIDEMGLTPDQWKAYPEFFTSYNKFRYPSFSYTYLGFNQRLPLFAAKEMRQALAAGINKQELIDGVLLGMGKPATGPFPPQSWAYDPAVTDLPYNPSAAAAALERLGWKDTDGDGYRERNGQKLAFTIMTNQGNKMRALSAEIIQAQLKTIGVKVSIRVIEWSAFVHQFIDQRNFEAVLLGWSLSRDPDQYAIWDSQQTGEGQYNFVSYRSDEVDRLLAAGRTTFGQKDRQRIYRRIHRVLADDLPYIFLYYPEALPVIHKRFRGPEVAPAGIGWNFYQWWVPEKEQKYRLKA